jgi:hypothetical protein
MFVRDVFRLLWASGDGVLPSVRESVLEPSKGYVFPEDRKTEWGEWSALGTGVRYFHQTYSW